MFSTSLLLSTTCRITLFSTHLYKWLYKFQVPASEEFFVTIFDKLSSFSSIFSFKIYFFQNIIFLLFFPLVTLFSSLSKIMTTCNSSTDVKSLVHFENDYINLYISSNVFLSFLDNEKK